MADLRVVCGYCGRDAELVDSAEVYNGRSYGMIWLCRPCEAWVGTHAGTRSHHPLGTLADAETREARKAAHAAFDPLWRAKMRRDGASKTEARLAGYAWLAKRMGMRTNECHIAMFDAEQCRRVVAEIDNWREEKRR